MTIFSEDRKRYKIPKEWVYERLICEFRHWDVCLDGLIDWDGEKWFCVIIGDGYQKPIEYNLIPIEWTEECEEYLEDYKVAYKHWFHTKGQRTHTYNGWDLNWFDDKWSDTNPIREQAGVK